MKEINKQDAINKIKVKIKCDRMYGTIKNWQDSSYFNDNTLQLIVDKFVKDGVLEITEEVVDFYNNHESVKNTNNKVFKTANSIANQMRKLIKKQNTKEIKEYIGIYRNPDIKIFYCKIKATNHEDAKEKFANKLLKDDKLDIIFEYYMNIIPLFDIETIG